LENHNKVISYAQIGKIQLKKGIFSSARDPSVDLEREIDSFLTRQKKKFNERVANTFDLGDEAYTKYEFFWISPRAIKISNSNDKIENTPVAFRSDADVTLIYLKERSLILFQTKFLFAITEPGCGGNGTLFESGGTDYELEEIYFNKITTVGPGTGRKPTKF